MDVVLAVDDDLEFLAILGETLTDQGWEVLVAGSAKAALRAARARRVDVVLTDLMMPFGNGQSLESAFRSDPALKDIPFVFMSGAIGQLKELAGVRMLVKPFKAEEAVAMLKSCLPERVRERL